MNKQYREFEVDGMGIFLDYLRRWWKPDPIARLKLKRQTKRLLTRWAESGVSAVNFFLWAHDHSPQTKLYWKYVPFNLTEQGYNLAKVRGKFKKGYKSFIKLLAECNLIPIHCTMMEKYCAYPFQYNTNKVPHMWHVMALEYIRNLTLTVLEIEHDVFGDEYEPTFRGWNEPGRGNGCMKDHTVADFHYDLYEYVRHFYYVQFGVNITPQHFYIDSSLSEYAHAWFAPESKCIHCGQKFGGRYLDEHGKPQVVIVNHGYSVVGDIDFMNYQAFLTSKFPLQVCGGDGGANDKLFANGYALVKRGVAVLATEKPQDGDFILYRQGTPYQTAKLMDNLLKLAKKYKKGVRYQLAFLETLPDGNENFDPKLIDWARVRTVKRVLQKHWGDDLREMYQSVGGDKTVSVKVPPSKKQGG